MALLQLRRTRAAAVLLVAALVLFTQVAWASSANGKVDLPPLKSLSLDDLNEQLQTCPIVSSLSAQKAAAHETQSSLTARLFAMLFPSSHPGVNALLATLYISGPPNFLLALCPTDIDPNSLSVMVAFAVGGLLGDTLFHLLPEIFLGEDDPVRARLVLVEPNRNLLLGVAILVGFLAFMGMDKTLKIVMGGAGHDHGHGHGHTHGHAQGNGNGEGKSTAVDKEGKDGAKLRKGKGKGKEEDEKEVTAEEKPKQLGGLLNMLADFTHNMADGAALAASFYASPTIGATTAVAIFFHEIPHEVGDFALLVQSGFTKNQAMGAQFVTAMGALIGTLIGIAVQEFGGAGEGAAMGIRDGLWGTSLTWGDMLLPFTAGTFLYVGTVAVIPELLETGPNKGAELRKTLVQFAAIFAGAGIMLWISWHD
ncbi:ZIP zinc transporter-domain-containing protein [Staphylotrichum tortipilum]|uniref:ZIP zinc transporter-domain-containing protein n=1 Tax=Staphylotrichum tortipilum TaxID=2831512 RepID=A0AAN6RS44_9PEZI|nr:ZIP zinc transporter-domain-containing protein [Staphylotrichum longicolle]